MATAASQWLASTWPLRGRAGALLVLALMGAATFGGWYIARTAVDEAAQLRFDAETLQIDAAIRARMAAYEQVLRGGKGLFAATADVDREDWATYVETLRLGETYPGIQGVGYSVLLAPEETEAHVAAVRAEGFPDYSIRPAGERPIYSAIVYLEPFDARNQRAFGFDMFQEPTRNAAMTRARDTGDAALSGKVILVQESDTDLQNGFLMYLPVYAEGAPTGTAEERQAAIEGWVYSPFRAKDLMKGILGPAPLLVSFEVFDGETKTIDSVLYDEDGDLHVNATGPRPQFTEQTVLSIAGRTWTVVHTSTPAFEAANESPLPLVVLLAGGAVSLLLFGVAYSLASTRERAVRMAERMTAELRASEEEKTRLAEDLARSNEDLQNFAYIASHDLQEPLRMVTSYMGLLDRRYRDRLDQDAREFIGFAVEGSTRMHVLINDLLEFSRVGTREMELALVESGTALDEAIANLTVPLEESGARITRDTLPLVRADEAQLTRVFQNLISNAIKYRGASDPHVHIGATREGREWVFRVKDDGIGIDPRFVHRLFVMFSRLHPRSAYPGSGMGLAICKRIITRHGGRIGVDSQLGQGATFFFTLPIHEGDPT